MNEKDRIIDRERKLLAMANDQSSPAEATIAAQRARRLMDTWQISKHDLLDVNDFTIGRAGKARKFTPKWENVIAVAVVVYNDCIVSYTQSSPVSAFQATFKGYGPDVEISVMVYHHLLRVGCTACSAALPVKRYNAKLGTIFKEAYASEVCDRLKKMAVDRHGEVAFQGGKELMVSKIKSVEDHFGHMSYIKTSMKKAKEDRERIAAALGRKAGQDVAINPQVNQTTKLGSV